MTSKLKQELKALLDNHPELSGRHISFSDADIAFVQPGDPAGSEQAQNDIPQKEIGQFVRVYEISPKVEVRLSPVHGYGVFAKEQIAIEEQIEHCRLLKLGFRANYLSDPVLKDYVWTDNDKSDEGKRHGSNQYIALGFGSIYNHSGQPNTIKTMSFEKAFMTIKAKQVIEKDQEIFISYGKRYFMIRDFWKNITRNNTLVDIIKDKGLQNTQDA